MTLAERLARHPNVTLTRYLGLASHPTHEAARRQLKGFGTIISFDVRGDADAADDVCAGLRLIQHATSLGAVESTIERRASIPGQEHLPPALLRLSVGIEAVEALWADLDRALRVLVATPAGRVDAPVRHAFDRAAPPAYSEERDHHADLQCRR
jgi:cystathionine gamma-synthase